MRKHTRALQLSVFLGLISALTMTTSGCDDDASDGATLDAHVDPSGADASVDPSGADSSVVSQPQALTAFEVPSITLTPRGAERLIVNYPVTVEAEWRVEATEALGAGVQILLVAQDGALTCVLGDLGLDHVGAAEPETYSAQAEFTIPESCQQLVQHSPVQVMVDLQVGDDPEDEPEAAAAPVAPARCALGSGAPCDEGVALMPSPGRDIVLESVRLSSSVATLYVPKRQARGALDRDVMLEHSEPDPEQPPEAPSEPAPPVDDRAPTVPHFTLMAAFKILGMPAGEETTRPIHFNFDLRPSPSAAGELPDEAIVWAPLGRRPSGAGEAPPHQPPELIVEDALADPYIGGSIMHRQMPVHISPSVGRLVTRGVWREVDEFELRLCIRGGFEELGPAGVDADENNCAIMPVVLLREDVGYGGETRGAPQEKSSKGSSYWSSCSSLGDAASYSSGSIDFTFDTWVEVGTRDTGSASDVFSSCGHEKEFSQGEDTEAWFYSGVYSSVSIYFSLPFDASETVSLVPVNLYAMLDVGSSGGGVDFQAQLFGYDILDPVSVSVSEGELISFSSLGLEAPSASLDITLWGFSIGSPLNIGASIDAGLEVGLDEDNTGFMFELLDPREDPCEGLETLDGLCFFRGYRGRELKTWAEYEQTCLDRGGYPAPIRDAEDYALAMEIADSRGPFWVGLKGETEASYFDFEDVDSLEPSSAALEAVYADALGVTSDVYTAWAENSPRIFGLDFDTSSDSCESSSMELLFSISLYEYACSVDNYVIVHPLKGMIDVPLEAGASSGVCAMRSLDGGTDGGIGFTVSFEPYVSLSVSGDASLVFFGLSGEIVLIEASAPISVSASIEGYGDGQTLIELVGTLDITLAALSGGIYYWYWYLVGEGDGTVISFDSVWSDTWNIINQAVSFSF